MLASPLEIRSSPHAIAAQGSNPPVIPSKTNGMTRPRHPSPNSGRPITRTTRASAMHADAERMSTSTIGLMSWTAILMNRNETPQISASATSARYGSSPARPSDTGRPVVRREHERDGTVVFDGHPHDCSKATGARLYSAFSESLHEGEVQLLGPVGIPSFEQAGTAAAAHVGEQRELRHDQRGALHVLEADVHPARFVAEHTHVDQLVREPAHVRFIVIRTCTHQQHEARADGCNLLGARLLPGHRTRGRPLRDYSHLLNRSSGRSGVPHV